MAYIIKKATYTNGIRTGLERIWDTTKKHCIVLMKSPSTADDMTDDRTTKRITGILRHNGYGSYSLYNIDTIHTILPDIPDADIIIAWGSSPPRYADTVLNILQNHKKIIKCFGKNKNNTPVMPTCLPYDTSVVMF